MGQEIHPKNSSVIRKAKYEEDNRQLEVLFVTGNIYAYLDVPPRLWKLFLLYVGSGGSAGFFFNKFIKNEFGMKKIHEA
jgi:hypothetical protein